MVATPSKGTILRIAAAVGAGLLAWIAVATVGNIILRGAVPGYTAVEAAMDFTSSMMAFRLLLGALASFFAGLVAAWIARRNRFATRILVGVLLLMFLPLHYSLWSKFPVWFHVTFLISLVLLTMFGASTYSYYLRSTRAHPSRADERRSKDDPTP